MTQRRADQESAPDPDRAAQLAGEFAVERYKYIAVGFAVAGDVLAAG